MYVRKVKRVLTPCILNNYISRGLMLVVPISISGKKEMVKLILEIPIKNHSCRDVLRLYRMNIIIFEHFIQDFCMPLVDASSLTFSDSSIFHSQISILFTEWWATKISFYRSCQSVSRESVNVQTYSNEKVWTWNCWNTWKKEKIDCFGSLH